MKIKRYIISAFIILFCWGLTSSYASSEKNILISQLIIQILNNDHLTPQKFDNNFSKRVFSQFIDKLDPNKQFFTKEAINSLKSYEETIDNNLLKGEFTTYNAIISEFRKRLQNCKNFMDKEKKEPFKLKNSESIYLDSEKRTFSQNNKDLKNQWSKIIRLSILQEYLSAYEKKYVGEPNVSIETITLKKDPALLEDAKNKTYERFNRRIARFQKLKDTDYFNWFMDVISQSHGPHSNYLPPSEKANFDIGMTGQLEGIGAVLKEEEGHIKVVRIIPGSASWKQKELEAEDTILKVAQSSNEPVDISNMPVSEAVKLIRGKKGTEVQLTVKKPNGIETVIPIIRDIVIVEETFAKGTLLLDTKHNNKIGFIQLPSFYRDFKNKNKRNASDDIKSLLSEFKSNQVDGVILDLRNNGGGALEDAVFSSGLFIESGPIVNIVNKRETHSVRSDLDPSISYSGPLIILINRFSASASEILSAALQDYNRAVIVGSPSFGKGTVQQILNLDYYLPRHYNGYKPLGSMKLTIQKFYRVNGHSTQYYGVTPDILLPSETDALDIGERFLEFSSVWKKDTPLNYKKWSKKPNISKLKRFSQRRLKKSTYFKTVINYNDYVKKNKTYPQSLNAFTYWDDKKTITHYNKRIESEVEALGKNNYLKTDAIFGRKNLSPETIKEANTELNKDPELHETIAIMNDLIEDYDHRYR